ncbi:MAG: phosphoribosyltransferase [Candidatus Heimdallarchaeota archaeon]|nr:phosphoribosyltransferase [Candidatus Heimdallarchaeota archaeon]
MIIEQQEFRNKYHLFKTREEAGVLLAPYILREAIDLVVIIPNGGMPVGYGLLKSEELSLIPFHLLIVKKIQVPQNTEAGMGAVTPDGQIFLNEQLVSQMSISDHQLQNQVDNAKKKIDLLKETFHLSSFPSVKNRSVLLVDDGIASGFSMLAGAKWLTKIGAKKVLAGVPTAPSSSLQRLEPVLEKIICLNVRERYPFAVADAYKTWHDVSLKEAQKYLQKIKKLYPNHRD